MRKGKGTEGKKKKKGEEKRDMEGRTGSKTEDEVTEICHDVTTL